MPSTSSADKNTIHKKIRTWFQASGWTLFDFQKKSCEAFMGGHSGLIHAPTGTGKTLAAWLAPVNQYLHTAAHVDNKQPPPLTVLWITPLKALAADTEKNLQNSLNQLSLNWSLERRTGDTSASARARQKKRLPTALITTPESLSLLISYPETAKQLKGIQSVVVDEWHELLGSKRAVQLELCLAFLRSHSPNLRTWGLSATLGNMEQAMEVLTGKPKQKQPKAMLIQGTHKKQYAIRSLSPEQVDRFPWAGHTGTRLTGEVIEAIENAKSTLLFVNTRSQAEIWFENILRRKPEWLECLGLHHGSLERKVRDYIENALRDGKMRCVVCTSSLDLGVDFSPVEQVIQIGSPKGIARLLQRAGRSGHSPDKTSEVVCVPTHAFELVEIAAARLAAERNLIERRQPLRLSLDVLVQHAVTLALSNHLSTQKTFREVKQTYAFANLTETQWQWVLDFITRGGNALQHYPQYKKVVKKGALYKVEDKHIARLHRSSVGTITSDASMRVKFLKGESLGTIEESFISRLTKEDAFLFNGRVLSLVQVKDMTAYVKLAKQKQRIVPRWAGGRLPLSTELADTVRELMCPSQKLAAIPELQKVETIRHIQSSWSHLPNAEELLVEQTKTREGHHLFIYPFAGRLVHEGLATLLAYRFTRQRSLTITVSANDYGFELLSRTNFQADIALVRKLLSTEALMADLIESINQSELAKRQFRDIARIAGLIIQGHPGQQKSTRQLQASSGLIFDVLKDYDADNLLLSQAVSEVLDQQLELNRLTTALNKMEKQSVVLSQPSKLTPMAFPLWAERLRGQIMSSEKWQDRVQRMVDNLEKTVAQAERTSARLSLESDKQLIFEHARD